MIGRALLQSYAVRVIFAFVSSAVLACAGHAHFADDPPAKSPPQAAQPAARPHTAATKGPPASSPFLYLKCSFTSSLGPGLRVFQLKVDVQKSGVTKRVGSSSDELEARITDTAINFDMKDDRHWPDGSYNLFTGPQIDRLTGLYERSFTIYNAQNGYRGELREEGSCEQTEPWPSARF
jgi:hypothetical protein